MSHYWTVQGIRVGKSIFWIGVGSQLWKCRSVLNFETHQISSSLTVNIPSFSLCQSEVLGLQRKKQSVEQSFNLGKFLFLLVFFCIRHWRCFQFYDSMKQKLRFSFCIKFDKTTSLLLAMAIVKFRRIFKYFLLFKKVLRIFPSMQLQNVIHQMR